VTVETWQEFLIGAGLMILEFIAICFLWIILTAILVGGAKVERKQGAKLAGIVVVLILIVYSIIFGIPFSVST